ncbi:histidine phosphatase family protein [Candidatus Poribacteria bacterium]|nr:histidine phosphatase family protein [Candidatus Poribacteria bacterium]
MPTTICLIRHGQTDWNKEKIFRGRADVPLNERGRAEARALSLHLEHVGATACYSSPLSRAVETAEIVAAPHSLSVKLEEGLTDMDYGKWQGLPDADAASRFPEMYHQWHETPHRVKFPNGESLAMVKKRVMNSLSLIVSSHPETTVFVTAHRVVCKVVMCVSLGLPSSAFWRIRQDNCAFNVIEFSEDNSTVALMNDTCHMSSAGIAPTLADF